MQCFVFCVYCSSAKQCGQTGRAYWDLAIAYLVSLHTRVLATHWLLAILHTLANESYSVLLAGHCGVATGKPLLLSLFLKPIFLLVIVAGINIIISSSIVNWDWPVSFLLISTWVGHMSYLGGMWNQFEWCIVENSLFKKRESNL